MSQTSSQGSPVDQKLLKYLLEDALQILSKQVTNPESKDFQKVTHLLKRCEVFQSIFPSQACLNDFVQLAKYYVSYEVHEYGTVLLREKEYADKFCMILNGSVEKFRQKPYREIEKEVHEERKRKSIAVENINLPNFSIPSLHLHGNNCRNHRPSRFIELTLPNRSKSPKGKGGIHLPLGGSSELKDGLHMRLESLADEKAQGPGLGLLNLKMPATEQKVCEENERVKAEKSPEEKKETEEKEEEHGQEESEDFKIPVKRCVTNNVQNPPLISNFSKMLERLSTHSFPKKHSDEIIKGAGDETPLIGSRVNLTEEELIRYLCKRDSEIKKTYFMEDVLRATKIKTYKAGEYFGESFCRPNFPKSNSLLAVSSEKVHLLVLSREDYNNIMAELERRGNEKLEVFWSIFPLADKKTVREFSQQFSQKSYQVDEVLYCQDDPIQGLYLLLSGEVKLCKESELCEEGSSPISKRLTSLSNIRSGEIPMVTVIKNQFFGEEQLLDMEYRWSTAAAKSPNTVTYFLEASAYEKIKENFVGFFEVLKKGAQEKFAWRQQKLSEANGNSHNNTPSTSPRKIQTHKSSKSIISPRTSILIADRQGSQGKLSIFLSNQKIASQTEKSTVSSPRSNIPSFDDKQIHSEEELPHNQRCEIYKSQFARKLVAVVRPNAEEGKVSQKAKEEDKAKRANLRKSMDFGPQRVLEEFNLRRDLYDDKKKVSHLVSPRGLGAKKKPLLPTTLPPLFDSPRISKLNKETSPQGFHHKPKQTSITGMQNFMPTHMIFERISKKKNSLEGPYVVSSYENSPKNEGFENIHVKKKVVPNKLRFK